ncbi:MAG: hypothetical protein M3O36_04555, partial [Myxococcota bacterium]|nr:hypothetical protein [Myxococcota bacterium]
LHILAPRDEPKRVWLERLDATAAAQAGSRCAGEPHPSSSAASSRCAPLPSGSARDAYRRVDLDTNDLWDALENPDASASIRAAAARVLARVAPHEGKRIVRVLVNERDDQARATMGAALEEDTEAAARRLEKLGSR